MIGSILITILCYLQYPNCWFGLTDRVTENALKESFNMRGTLRFNVPGKFLSCLFIFYIIQHFRFSYLQIVQLLLLFIFLIFSGHRFPIAVCVLLSVIMIFCSRIIEWKRKLQIIIISSLIAYALFVIPTTRNTIDKLVEMTEEGGADDLDDDNIRLRSSYYFFNEFNAPDDYYHIILGNGMCFPNSGKYADKMEAANQRVFYCLDVEFCEFYIYWGIIGLVFLVLFFLGAFVVNVPKEFIYVKYFMLFILVTMTCGGYWVWNFIFISMLSYVLIVENRKLTKCKVEKK